MKPKTYLFRVNESETKADGAFDLDHACLSFAAALRIPNISNAQQLKGHFKRENAQFSVVEVDL